MEKSPIDIGNSAGRYEGIYLDIMNLTSHFPDIDQINKLHPHRFREPIEIVLFHIKHRAGASFPACRSQLLNGPPRTSETLTYPTLLATAVIFHFSAQDARHTRLGGFARDRITKIRLFHIANLPRATYCANFGGRTDPPASSRPELLDGGDLVPELSTSFGWRISKQAGKRGTPTNGG